jgi:hypothetical protein
MFTSLAVLKVGALECFRRALYQVRERGTYRRHLLSPLPPVDDFLRTGMSSDTGDMTGCMDYSELESYRLNACVRDD